MAMSKPVLGMMLAAGVASAMWSCNRVDQAAVAARVNGRELPLSLFAGEAPERSGDAVARALDKAIDQELLVQGAIDRKLDRDPRTVQAIENARRQILAQAYVDRVIAPAVASQKEVREFYQRNPALFAQRRIYRFQEISVEGPREKLDVLKEQVSSARDVAPIVGWLKEQKFAFRMANAVRPAEQVPLHYLPRLAEMKDGEISVVPTPTGAAVLQLVQAQDAALTEPQAAPVIERFLSSRRRLQLAEKHVAQLREKARIEYVGDYAVATRTQSSISGRSSSGTIGKGGYAEGRSPAGEPPR